MSYEIETKDGIVLKNIPDHLAPDAPELKALVAQERSARGSRKAQETAAKFASEDHSGEAAKMATEGMGMGEKALVNLGAGIDSAWQGAKQILPGFKGASDEEVRDKRARDKALAANTDLGVGADWMPTAGSAAQFVGEALPTLAVPAGAATGVAGRVLPRAMQALVSTPIRAGAAGGALAGALQPTLSTESRAINTGLGAAGGAVLPGAMAAYTKGRRMLTQGGTMERAGEKFVQDLGEQGAQDAAVGAGLYYPRHAENIPMSTATALRNPRIAMMERESRSSNPAAWSPFDDQSAAAVWNNVERGTANAADLGEHQAARSAGWNDRATAAFNNLKPRNWKNELEGFKANIEQAKMSPAGQNQMRGVLNEIDRQITELGDNITPQHLAALRAQMSGAIKGAPDSPFATAPRSDPYYISLKDELDRILNQSTGGKWQRVPEGYAADSVPVGAAKTSQAIRETFMTPQGITRGAERGGVPNVSAARLSQTMAKNAEHPRFGDQMAPESRDILQATLDALRGKDYLQQVKGTGTSGGGSDTVMNAMNVYAQRRAGHGGSDSGAIMSALKSLWNVAQERGDKRLNDEITRALQNPDHFVAMIDAARRSNAPISATQQAVYSAIAGGSGAAAPALMQQQ